MSIESLNRFTPPAEGVALLVGNFDGVHLGHRRLIDTAHQHAAEAGLAVVALTFEPHPIAILAPDRAPPRLTVLEEKRDHLLRAGVDHVVVLETDAALLATPANAFLEMLAERMRPRIIVEGPTFNFGRGRAGSIVTLQEHAARLGYRAIIVDELYGHELGGDPPINSSAIRAALREGRVEDAAAMLGRPHRIAGVVGSGQGRGTPIGFPTANLDRIPQMLPQHAVYSAAAQLSDGRLLAAAVNIGPQPTFAQMTARVEAHLLDFAGDVRGQTVGLHLQARIRPQTKFGGADELIAQIRRDCDVVRDAKPHEDPRIAATPLPDAAIRS